MVPGGRIDRVYYCPHDHADRCACRKPGTAMALRAQEDFPEIDFRRCFMVGDAASDMELGRRLGCVTVFIGDAPPPETDHVFPSLFEFASFVRECSRSGHSAG